MSNFLKNKKMGGKNPLKKYIKGKAAVFIDYANLKSWLKDKNLFIDLKILYHLLTEAGIKKIFFYYGADSKNPFSAGFFNKLRLFGFQIVTKPVKYIKINLNSLIKKRVNQKLINKLTLKTKKSFFSEIKKLEKQKIKFLLPKANFDVEITLDMVLFSEKFNTFVLFSGDGDFTPTVKYLRSKNKKVIIVSGRKFLAGELLQAANKFITLERFFKKQKNLLKKAKPPKRRF